MDERELDFLATPSTDESNDSDVKEIKETVVKEAEIKDAFLADDLEEVKPVVTPSFIADDTVATPDTNPVVETVQKEEVAPESYVTDTSSDEDFLAEDKPKAPKKTEDPVYMVRQFNMGKEDELADKDKFARKDEPKKKSSKKQSKSSNGKKKLRTYQQRQNILGYSFMAPWIIGFVMFTLFPFVATIVLSFCNVKHDSLGYKIRFNGIDNYITAFVKNGSFTPALVEYLKVIVPYTFIVVVLSFIIAYLLNKITVGKGILRTIYFLPVIIMSGPVMEKINAVDENMLEAAQISGSSIGGAYDNIFIMQIINSYSPQLGDMLSSIFDQLSLILWFTGIPIVLFINALQKINVSIYEAAKIDSANAWQIMWKITIPMLKSIGLIVTVFTVIQLGMYGTINPLYDLIVEMTGKTSDGLGFAAAYSWIYSFVVLVIVGIVFLLFREKKGKRGA